MNGPSQPVELHAGHNVHAASPYGPQESIQGWPALLRAALALVDELGDSPAAGGGEGSEREKLVLGRLTRRAHATVDASSELPRGAHHAHSFSRRRSRPVGISMPLTTSAGSPRVRARSTIAAVVRLRAIIWWNEITDVVRDRAESTSCSTSALRPSAAQVLNAMAATPAGAPFLVRRSTSPNTTTVESAG